MSSTGVSDAFGKTGNYEDIAWRKFIEEAFLDDADLKHLPLNLNDD